MPPWSEVIDLTLKLLVPAFAVSLLVALVLGRWVGMRLAVALAVLTGWIAGSSFREVIPWRLDAERPLLIQDWRNALAVSLEAPPPSFEEETPSIQAPPVHYWLLWLGALAMLTELLSVGSVGWAMRGVVATFAGRLLTPMMLRAEHPWTPWCLALVILLQWGILSALAKHWRDGLILSLQAICLCLAAGVILHAHSARLTDAALVVAASLVGPAILSFFRPGGTEAPIAAGSVLLPGLLLVAHQETFSEVPRSSFLLAGLAPLALALVLLPILSRQTGWKRWMLATLPLIPAALALFWAAQVESLPF